MHVRFFSSESKLMVRAVCGVEKRPENVFSLSTAALSKVVKNTRLLKWVGYKRHKKPIRKGRGGD
jgi:hypothetical protein